MESQNLILFVVWKPTFNQAGIAQAKSEKKFNPKNYKKFILITFWYTIILFYLQKLFGSNSTQKAIPVLLTKQFTKQILKARLF